MTEKPKFQVVDQITDAGEPNSSGEAGARMLMLGLRALSQRAIVALGNLFVLAAVGSAFWLWYLTPRPDQFQIVSLTIYALFVLAAIWLVRRK